MIIDDICDHCGKLCEHPDNPVISFAGASQLHQTCALELMLRARSTIHMPGKRFCNPDVRVIERMVKQLVDIAADLRIESREGKMIQ